MKTLYINTAQDKILLILFEKYKILKQIEVENQKHLSQFLMPSVKKILDGINLDYIVVVVGPGSFTGVRLGVVVAKTLAYLKNIPIITITSLEERAIFIKKSEKIVKIKEHNGYFIGFFDACNSAIKDYIYVKDSEFNNFLKKHNIDSEKEINYSALIKYALKKEPTNPHLVNPVYVKKIGVGND